MREIIEEPEEMKIRRKGEMKIRRKGGREAHNRRIAKDKETTMKKFLHNLWHILT